MISQPEEFQRQLADYVAGYQYRVREENGQQVLALENHVVMPWQGKRKHRLFQGEAPSSFHYEPVATAVLDYLLDTQTVTQFMDLGAANGYFALIAAGRTDKEIEAFAFDMQPYAFEAMQKQAASLGIDRLHPHLSGMSDKYEGEQKIWYSVTKMFQREPDPSEYRDNVFKRFKFWLKGRSGRDELKTAMVTIDSIDHYCASKSISPEVIKIDVDGYEQKVIAGGLETFRKNWPFIMLEIHKMTLLGRFVSSRRDVVKPLYDLGYRCLFFDNHHFLDRANPILVDLDHPLWDRERTDFVLFF